MNEVTDYLGPVAIVFVTGLGGYFTYKRGQRADDRAGYGGLLDRSEVEAMRLRQQRDTAEAALNALREAIEVERQIRITEQKSRYVAEERANVAEQRLADCLEGLDPQEPPLGSSSLPSVEKE